MMPVAGEWRLIIDPPATGARNMAIDEALLRSATRGCRPTLRFYAWQPPALSLGYFQKADVVDFAACAAAGVDVVRRPTGGRAVLHADEVTYAVALPPEHPLAQESVVNSYRVLSKGFAGGLATLGAAASLSRASKNRDTAGVPEPAASGQAAACFDTPSWYELLVDGQKVVGSAQVRRAGALLQHGSVPLTLAPASLYRLLRFGDERLRERAEAHLARKAAGLADALRRPLSWESVVEALAKGLAKALGCTMLQGSLEEGELAELASLEAKHGSAGWVHHRGKE